MLLIKDDFFINFNKKRKIERLERELNHDWSYVMSNAWQNIALALLYHKKTGENNIVIEEERSVFLWKMGLVFLNIIVGSSWIEFDPLYIH